MPPFVQSLRGALAVALLACTQAGAQTAGVQTPGAQTYQAVCAACHAEGLAKAPKLGDAARWKPLIAEGQVELTAHGYVGVRGMPAKGGREDLSVADFAAALVHMVNQSGGRWQNPDPTTLKRIEDKIKKRQAQLAKKASAS